MKTMLMIAATLGVTLLGGCATYATGYSPGDYYYYEAWGYDGGGRKGHNRYGGREPGNESGMGHVGRSRAGGGGGASRGGEAGSR